MQAMQELHIHHFRVDLQRGRVHDGETVTALEPRVLQVLLYLARHQGEVVSHQALMEAVWGQSIVDPSTLQRCIGQLRRAFGDDARQQHTIATYPKNGYSLLPEVTWHNLPARGLTAPLPGFLKRAVRPALAGAAGAMLLGALLILVLAWNLTDDTRVPQTPLSGQDPEAPLPVEHTDFYAVYSPDGRYVAYSRAYDSSHRQLRGRDLSNGREFPLTEEPGNFEDLTWSPDSSRLAFIVTSSCSALNAVSMEEASTGAAVREPLTECGDTRLSSPQWVGRNRIALIEGEKVIELDLRSNERRLLYAPTEARPQHLAWSAVKQQLAVLEKDREGDTALLLISDIGNRQPSFNRISLPAEMAGQQLHLLWNPGASGLLISTATELYNVGLDGNITRQAPPFLPDSAFPSQH